MRSLLLIGKMNDVLKNMLLFLKESYDVQIGTDNLEGVESLISMVEPEIIIVSLVGLYESDSKLLWRLKNDYYYIPVITVGTKEELSHFIKFYQDGKFENVTRPVSNAELLKVIERKLNPKTILDEVIVEEPVQQVVSDDTRKVTLVVFKHSVVMRGVRRRLTESNMQVVTIVGGFDQIRNHLDTTDVFVVSLPEDLISNDVRLLQFSRLYEELRKYNGPVIIVGDEYYLGKLRLSFPGVIEYIWVFKPISSDQLFDRIEDVFDLPVQNSTREKKRILIVDDDPQYAGMVRSWIEHEYQADVVTAGLKAITFLMNHKVDLILLDYEMPVCDGPRVFQMLRQEPDTKDIPVVFLTGVNKKEDVARVVELKPNGYLLKSATKEDILRYLYRKLNEAED